MKTTVFSDTHLTTKFIPEKFEFLQKVIGEADQVVINGDFWDGYFITFDQFLDSDWKKLFPLLKSKKTIYIPGNHDTKEMLDKRTELFSHQVKEFVKIKSGKNNFHIEHGNRLSPELSAKYPFLKRNLWLLRPITWVEDKLEWLINKTIGNIPHHHQNAEMIAKKNVYCQENEYLVCGHSHRFEINHKEKFINTGSNKFAPWKYLVIKNDKFELKFSQ